MTVDDPMGRFTRERSLCAPVREVRATDLSRSPLRVRAAPRCPRTPSLPGCRRQHPGVGVGNSERLRAVAVDHAQRLAGSLDAVERQEDRSVLGYAGREAGDIEGVAPDRDIRAGAELAKVGQSYSVIEHRRELGRGEPSRRQPELVKRCPELITGTGVVGATCGGRRAGGGAAENDSEVRGQNVGEHQGAREY